MIATGRSTRRVRATDGNGVARDVDVDYASVALDVAPVDAQRLVLAQRTGEVTVLLRGAGDVFYDNISTLNSVTSHWSDSNTRWWQNDGLAHRVRI